MTTTSTPDTTVNPDSTDDRTLDEVPGGTEVFASVQDVHDQLQAVGYLTDDRIATTLYLATRLGRPLLLEGPAGVGKTDLARAVSIALGRRLVRLQCYESQDESKALYEWDYGKQLLYIQLLRDKINEVVGDAPDLDSAVDAIAGHDDVFFSPRFLSERPILAAIRSEEPVVLLIDEVDRSEEALEAVLLETLAENQISIPEIGTIVAQHPPLVLLTSNNTRDLSSALKRRCLHLFLDYPDHARELEIVRSKDTGLEEALASELVALVQDLRGLDLRKAPSIAETVDWARTLAVLGVRELDPAVLRTTVNVVMKYERDLERALAFLDVRYADTAGGGATEAAPAAQERAEPARREQTPREPARTAPTASGGDPSDTDRRAIRDAYDTPGRHGAAAFFGARGSGSPSGTKDSGTTAGNRRRPV